VKGAVRGMGKRSMPLGGVVAGVVALNLLGGSAMAAAPAKAPKPQDVTAARTVIRAITRFDQTAVRREGAMTAAAKALVAQVKAGCADGIPASIANGTAQQQAVAFDLIFEGAFDLSLDSLHPVVGPGRVLSRSLGRVHFSKHAFTHDIHTIAKIQSTLLAMKASDLCADVKAAAANGFTADPPGTTAALKAFARVLAPGSKGVTGVLKGLKSDLTTDHDRAALKRLQTVDARYQKFSTNLGLKWGAKLGNILSPPSTGTGPGGFPTTPPPPPPTGSVRRARITSAFAALS
jgi:hypothetical protein